MKSYGPKIQYDSSSIPIKMSIPIGMSKAMRHKFTVDYGLPPISEGTSSGELRIVYTFHESVDEYTFIRHLQTMTPEQYEDLAQDSAA